MICIKIEKVLNNNVIVTKNKIGKEIVAMGCGIAFRKKNGDEVDPSQIRKIYTLADQGIFSKFQAMLAEIPMEYMLLSEQIIDYAKSHLKKKLSDSIYVTLPDHISAAIERYRNGILIENPLKWDIKNFYPDEFAVSCRANQLVLQKTGVKFAEDEAAFITMHFVNAEMEGKVDDSYLATQIMKDVSDAVSEYFHIEFDESSLTYYRFINHLKFFAQRLFRCKNLKSPEEQDVNADLLGIIMANHKQAYDCAKQIRKMTIQKYSFDFGNEEMLYLTIHIARVARGSKA